MSVLCDHRPELQVVVNCIAELSGTGLWVRERKFNECIRENELTLNGTPLSVTKFKKSLNWLVSHGYVTRLLYEQVKVNEKEHRLMRVHRDDRKDYYQSRDHHWEYCPLPRFGQLLQPEPAKKVPYFVS